MEPPEGPDSYTVPGVRTTVVVQSNPSVVWRIGSGGEGDRQRIGRYGEVGMCGSAAAKACPCPYAGAVARRPFIQQPFRSPDSKNQDRPLSRSPIQKAHRRSFKVVWYILRRASG